MSVFLGIAIFLIWWWLAFFAVLPLGAESAHEAGEPTPSGFEPGAPKVHRLGAKALLAAGIAAILWLVTAWAISVDLFNMRP